MRTTLRILRTAVLVAAALAVGGSLAAQTDTKGRTRKHTRRIFAAQTGPDQVTLAWDEVPGATEYRVYLPDPNTGGPPAPGARPLTTFSGSGRRAIVAGVRRVANGAYLEAVGDGEVLYRGTFNAVARAPLSPVAPPGSVRAQETGETEVTVSWNSVPGATAYMIARAVAGSGWQMACDLCPPTAEFVDTTATPGLKHSYSVQAIFPLGISARTPSNTVLVGAAQLAAATAASQTTAAVWDKPMSSGTPVAGTDADNSNVGASTGTPTTGTPTGGTTTPTTGTPTPGTPTTGCPPGTVPIVPKTSTPTIWTKEMSTGTPVAGTDADNSNVGASGGTTTTGTPTTGCTPIGGTGTPTTGTPTGGTGTPSTWTGGTPGYTPPGTSSGYTPPGTSTGYTPPGTPTGGTSVAGSGTATAGAGSLQPPAQISATATGVAAGSAWVSWAASPSAGVTGYVLFRSVNGAAFTPIRQLGVGMLGYADTAYTRLMFSQGTVNARYYMVAVGLNGASSGPSTVTPQLQIQAPALTPLQQMANTVGQIAGNVTGSVGGLLGGSSTDPHQATPAPGATPAPATPPATLPSCKLDYQRADNMWAAAGRPDGNLGTESIAEAYGQTKVFITDWAYEKRVNDGNNYYGSHLRIATNTGAGVVALRLNNPTAALFGGVTAGVAQKLGTGALVGFVVMKPGDRAEFRDDLREVRCGQ